MREMTLSGPVQQQTKVLKTDPSSLALICNTVRVFLSEGSYANVHKTDRICISVNTQNLTIT